MTIINTIRPSSSARGESSTFASNIRGSDVFFVSYPRSGMSWLAMMVANALKRDGGKQIDLKTLNDFFPNVNPVDAGGTSLGEFSGAKEQRFFRCHVANTDRLPKAVYMVRDPRDTMVSLWHYQKFLHPNYEQSLANFLAADDHWPCEWDEHVASWMLPEPRANVLVVRYEDLHNDAPRELKKVIDFTGNSCDVAGIDAAVEVSRFENMRATEEKHRRAENAGEVDERVIRVGRVGSWQNEMGYKELRLIEEKYGRMMRLAGYAPLS